MWWAVFIQLAETWTRGIVLDDLQSWLGRKWRGWTWDVMMSTVRVSQPDGDTLQPVAVVAARHQAPGVATCTSGPDHRLLFHSELWAPCRADKSEISQRFSWLLERLKLAWNEAGVFCASCFKFYVQTIQLLMQYAGEIVSVFEVCCGSLCHLSYLKRELKWPNLDLDIFEPTTQIDSKLP